MKNILLFSVLSMTIAQTALAEYQTIQECAQEAIKAAQAAQNAVKYSIPAGAVIAFDLESCPKGWDDYKKAYGRFIRGIDKTDKRVDPDGRRTKGNLQEDNIKAHSHGIGVNGADTSTMVPGGAAQRLAHFRKDIYGGGGQKRTDPEGKTETRPKNVALLYCIKK